jgi:hypothetical protein
MAQREVSDQKVVDIMLEEYPSHVGTPHEDGTDESEDDCYVLQQQQQRHNKGTCTSGGQRNISRASAVSEVKKPTVNLCQEFWEKD